MVSEAEFTMSLAKFGKTSADVRLAADKMIAVANVDVSKINDGLMVLMKWGVKIATTLFHEINKTPSLREEILEAQKTIFGNLDVISGVLLKFGPYLNQIATNTGLISLASKVLGVIFGV